MPSRWVHEHRFPDRAALAAALAGEVKVDLEEAIAARGVGSLVVSGGRTPVRLFAQLRDERLDWPRVWVTLADERWVETNTAASNERFVRETLLLGPAAAAHFVGLKNPAATPEAGADWATRALTRVPHPFDVVVLGMGEDGHTASLFPGSMALARGLDPAATPACIAVNALVAPHARVSLNLAALLDARRIVLHIEGDAKWAVYQRALAPGTAAELPVRAVLQQKEVPVDVFWAA
jgi:6-phosphogluconolactonase